MSMCVCVCLSASIYPDFGTTRVVFVIFCACYLRLWHEIFLWRRCDTLCTSDFTVDVIFARDGRLWTMWKHDDNVAASDVSASSCAG